MKLYLFKQDKPQYQSKEIKLTRVSLINDLKEFNEDYDCIYYESSELNSKDNSKIVITFTSEIIIIVFRDKNYEIYLNSSSDTELKIAIKNISNKNQIVPRTALEIVSQNYNYYISQSNIIEEESLMTELKSKTIVEYLTSLYFLLKSNDNLVNKEKEIKEKTSNIESMLLNIITENKEQVISKEIDINIKSLFTIIDNYIKYFSINSKYKEYKYDDSVFQRIEDFKITDVKDLLPSNYKILLCELNKSLINNFIVKIILCMYNVLNILNKKQIRTSNYIEYFGLDNSNIRISFTSNITEKNKKDDLVNDTSTTQIDLVIMQYDSIKKERNQIYIKIITGSFNKSIPKLEEILSLNIKYKRDYNQDDKDVIMSNLYFDSLISFDNMKKNIKVENKLIDNEISCFVKYDFSELIISEIISKLKIEEKTQIEFSEYIINRLEVQSEDKLFLSENQFNYNEIDFSIIILNKKLNEYDNQNFLNFSFINLPCPQLKTNFPIKKNSKKSNEFIEGIEISADLFYKGEFRYNFDSKNIESNDTNCNITQNNTECLVKSLGFYYFIPIKLSFTGEYNCINKNLNGCFIFENNISIFKSIKGEFRVIYNEEKDYDIQVLSKVEIKFSNDDRFFGEINDRSIKNILDEDNYGKSKNNFNYSYNKRLFKNGEYVNKRGNKCLISESSNEYYY